MSLRQYAVDLRSYSKIVFPPLAFRRQQYQAFKESGRNVDGIPLVLVQEVMKYMPQLTYMMQNQEQAPAKRSRIS